MAEDAEETLNCEMQTELKEIVVNSDKKPAINEFRTDVKTGADDSVTNHKDYELDIAIDKNTSTDSLDKGNKQKRLANQRNTYAAKKTVAQGMMDVALITANANQLRYLIEYQNKSSTFYFNVSLIVCSLLLQIAVGVSLIFKGRYDMKGESKSVGAQRINNYVVVGVFLTTIINVFVAAFSVSAPLSLITVNGTVFEIMNK